MIFEILVKIDDFSKGKYFRQKMMMFQNLAKIGGFFKVTYMPHFRMYHI